METSFSLFQPVIPVPSSLRCSLHRCIPSTLLPCVSHCLPLHEVITLQEALKGVRNHFIGAFCWCALDWIP